MPRKAQTAHSLEGMVKSMKEDIPTCQSQADSALLATIIFVLEIFLNNQGLLRATAADYFSPLAPGVQFTSRWLLAHLTKKLCNPIQHTEYTILVRRMAHHCTAPDVTHGQVLIQVTGYGTGGIPEEYSTKK